jgi:hypothetical protein
MIRPSFSGPSQVPWRLAGLTLGGTRGGALREVVVTNRSNGKWSTNYRIITINQLSNY